MLDSPQVGAVPLAASVSSWPGTATRVLVPLFAATLFLSSFLMFTVEPMVARQMLPVLGGVPMVWNGCVVFFQAMLLAGYGGAHVLTRGLVAPARLPVYAAVAVVPLTIMRLGVDAASAGHATQAPLSWLLVALLTSVGPSFLVLAVSASVIQATFSSTRHAWARDPYFLYAASNAGSLAALIAYPTVVEPLLGLSRQAYVWTIGYGVFVLLVLACAVAARFALAGVPVTGDAAPGADAPAAATETITWWQRARWCVLAAVPSSLMLGVTTALTTDIAPVPLLWVAPLALYLLTFILAFGSARERATVLANRLLPALLLGLAVTMMIRRQLPIAPALLLHLIPFLAAAMLCHGLLARERPSPRHLTEFYLCLAFGGMAGGLFNTLAAPLLFSRILEYPLALAAVVCLRPVDPARGAWQRLDWVLPLTAAGLAAAVVFVPSEGARSTATAVALAACAILTLRRRHQPATLAAVAGIFLLASPWVKKPGESVLHAERTFFGAYRVSVDRTGGAHWLAHGTTLHGMQYVEATRRGEPLTYYHRTGPFGRMMAAMPGLQQPGEIAAVGLGVGTLAAYARPGQRWTFFEIDPAVERIARDDRYFTYLKDCGDRCRVVLGDARLSLMAQPDARYRLIVLDAFSSDAVPMHLMTHEAMALYLSRLEEHGVMAFHVSNRHLNLGPVVGRLAANNGLVALPLRDQRSPSWPSEKATSAWVMVARTTEDLAAIMGGRPWTPPPVEAGTPLWTDDFSNVFDVLEIRLR
ncbi:MAG TPA: fused MFS/spermidine synthase [Vicinamibacterales bacterium]|nr:fused MFS/spermidine synthase [Vicinamibacterales bacterium]